MESAASAFRGKRADMVALVDGVKDLDGESRSDVKSYLDGFFRTIERPASVKRQFVDGCKPTPTM